MYRRYLREEERPEKLGRHKGYQGGSVWKTKEEAKKFCKEDYSVYGVIADWEKDTEPNKDGLWNDLLIDAKLVDLK